MRDAPARMPLTILPSAAPSGFFALRTPLLPHDVLSRLSADLRAPRAEDADLAQALAEDRTTLLERLRALVREPEIREALFVASPSLDEAIDAWLDDPVHERAHGVADILIRYLGRMTARPTPFGLFSGCSVGPIGAETRLSLGPRASYRRHTRLDMHYLSALCEALHRDPSLRAALTVRPSTGLYPSAGQLRYAEGRVDPKTRALSYHLVSVDRTDYLQATLARAGRGARPGELASALVLGDPEITREEADAYVESLIESQILTPDLSPPITGDEPVLGILGTLRACADGEEVAGVLQTAHEAIRALDADGLGLAPSRYRTIADALASLPAKPEIARLFQVDLYKPMEAAELGGEVLRELSLSVSLFARIAAPVEQEALKRFREAFTERYEGATVPLVEVLDEESGIGFHSSFAGSSEPTPLLDGLDLPPGPSSPQVAFGPRERHLLRRLGEVTRARQTTLELGEADLSMLSSREPAELPDAFAVTATLAAASAAALDRGDFRLFVHGISGPSGALLLGRFCHGDPALRSAVLAHLAAEEAARPDAIFAEIVHLPEGRLGNILCRPVLRAWEIPYLGRSGAPESRQIPIGDLRVGLSTGGRIILSSARHGREVIPRLTSAHNFGIAALGVYRFLCALQRERASRSLGFSWGALDRAPFLPRVSCGRVVLSLATWNLFKDQLAPLRKGKDVDRYRALQRLRAELALPRWVGLADGDNVLPIDLDNVLHVESLAQLVKGRETATLTELASGDDLVCEGPEGRFVHELVVPFNTKRERPASPAPLPFTAPRAAPARVSLPGSDWLFAKVYSGTATSDAVLKDVITPVVEDARASGIAEGWFFLRYGDPHWHLRLRIRGEAAELASTTLPALREAAEPLLRDGRIWKLELGTYAREIERYGGHDGIELCEALFEADSDAVLAIVGLLEADEGADARWRLTLRGMHLLLVDLGLDLAQRTEVVRRARAGFGAEHHVDVGFEKQLGARFRAERPLLEALLSAPVGSDHPLDPGFALLAARSEKNTPIARALAARAAEGRLTLPIQELAGSLLHMHANRLLRSEQRAQELVLYDFLLRLYESEAARARRPPPVQK